MQSYPKIFSLGTDYIRDIFLEPVEVSEKVDGSQFAFGKINGELRLRSKGASLYTTNPQKMFAAGISYVESIQDRLPEGMIFYGEYLRAPKHNSLTYNRTPKNHIALFGVMDMTQKCHPNIQAWADILEVDHVPIIHAGNISGVTEIAALMDRESYLGGPKIEGLVVKNYHRQFLLGGQPMPLMAGKLVSESFKEVHRERWGAEEKSSSRMETFFESFRTHARWEKAVQHLAERGELENQPRDIGKLFKEIHIDIEAEEEQNAKEFLWCEFKDQIKRRASAGFPEWYKMKLAERSFDDSGEVKP